jgi:hypothetical protein
MCNRAEFTNPPSNKVVAGYKISIPGAEAFNVRGSNANAAIKVIIKAGTSLPVNLLR